MINNDLWDVFTGKKYCVLYLNDPLGSYGGGQWNKQNVECYYKDQNKDLTILPVVSAAMKNMIWDSNQNTYYKFDFTYNKEYIHY